MTTDPGRAKILVVDDETEVCSLLREFFQDRYDVETAHDGAEALRKIGVFRPDCVLLDIRMPNLDGREVLRLTKPSYPEMEIIMITGVGDGAMAGECQKLGAFAYIMKPIDLDFLERQVRSALKKKGDKADD
ncbi:MAG: response regulator [Nitrospinae bacterium]|nr:response regulator [Nitrospinota bacterium]